MNLSFKIKKSIEVVYSYLTDMEKFTSIHPVITRIDPTSNDAYLVHETLTLGFIPFSFTYPVKVEKNVADKTVIIRATVFKLTKIEIKFVLTEKEGFTTIEEQIKFNSPLPIKPIMQKIFKKQHAQLFRNMEVS